ncbi:MAG TPA: NAD(P)/FAD-dependent oxidoreductase, partial [Acidimicrobiales bacterium]|nr:NAD(P)/FAD-dependent oxidoreductase [Acidimicrobiales bacterium]
VAPGVRCEPIGALSRLHEPPDGFVIIGAGKTAMDAVCWLLDAGVDPGDITWIRPREPWVLNRRFFQPGEGAVTTFDGIVRELEAVVESAMFDEVVDRLEAQEFMWRIDPAVRPTMHRGATVSRGELEQLRRVERVVRLGHVVAIGPDAITLDGGSVPTTPGRLHVHCASAGLADNPPRPVFGDGSIVLQPISRVNLCLSAGLIAVAEASGRSTADKNRLLPPNTWFDTAFDFFRHVLVGMRTELGWEDAPELTEFLDGSRLNIMKGLDDAPDKGQVAELQGRFLTALFPALEKLDTFAAQATPAERARLFDPAG